MKWTVRVKTTEGVIHSVEVKSGKIDGLTTALEKYAEEKRITLKEIVSIEPHQIIKVHPL